jgi:hypothetical protein
VARKKKRIEKVVISRAYYDVLDAKSTMLDDIFSADGALIGQNDFKDYDRLMRAYDKLDADTSGPDPFVPSLEKEK